MKVLGNGATTIKFIWRRPTYEEASEFFGGLSVSRIGRWKQDEEKIRRRVRLGRHALRPIAMVEWEKLQEVPYCTQH